MIAPRGLNPVELDPHASSPNSPYAIITVDCPSPKEIDDGIFVEALPAAEETYRVGVCVADTSQLYSDNTIFRQAMERTEAKYWELPEGGEIGYDPMIEPEAIRELEFAESNVRDALIVSFTVGRSIPPTDIDIGFGKVEVKKNLGYEEFWQRCLQDGSERSFGRASALLIRHLQYRSGGDYDFRPGTKLKKIYGNLIYGSWELWRRGSMINQSFMIAANHLVGKTLEQEGWPAIYRVHDPKDDTLGKILTPEVARYSTNPGRHVGLNVEPYCRVTSPLRRLEDFVMSYQLKQRYLGKTATFRDIDDLASAVEQLNTRVILTASEKPGYLSKRDILAKQAAAQTSECDEQTEPLNTGFPEAAIA